MTGQWHGGKGSKPRTTDKVRFNANWDKIFKTTKEMPVELGEGFYGSEADERGGSSEERLDSENAGL